MTCSATPFRLRDGIAESMKWNVVTPVARCTASSCAVSSETLAIRSLASVFTTSGQKVQRFQ